MLQIAFLKSYYCRQNGLCQFGNSNRAGKEGRAGSIGAHLTVCENMVRLSLTSEVSFNKYFGKH